MLNEKLLASNVLRRIYKDSGFQATRFGAEGNSAKLAGNEEVAEEFAKYSKEHAQTASTAFNELKARGEALN
jgi:hypothetical protein